MTTAMKTRATWIGLILICCAPLIAWMASVNGAMSYFRLNGLPPGQQLYLVAKLSGLFAFFLFWLQCMLALARYAPMLPDFPVSDFRLHRRLGGATALLMLAHVALFIVAASLRTGHAAWDLLVPNFTHGYYRLNIGLGAIAFWIVCLTIFAGYRVAQGQWRWKVIHLLWPVVFGLAFLHAFAIGTESRYGAMRYLVIFIAVSLAVSAVVRWQRTNKTGGSDSTVSHPTSGVAR